jgi:hypothetical protein
MALAINITACKACQGQTLAYYISKIQPRKAVLIAPGETGFYHY